MALFKVPHVRALVTILFTEKLIPASTFCLQLLLEFNSMSIVAQIISRLLHCLCSLHHVLHHFIGITLKNLHVLLSHLLL